MWWCCIYVWLIGGGGGMSAMGTPYLKFWSNCVSNAFSIACSRMSRWPYVVLLLATRCLYLGVTSYLKCVTNCVSNACSLAFSRMWRWPYVVLLLANRCLYQGGTSYLKCLTNCVSRSAHLMGTGHLKIWECQDDLMLYSSWSPDASILNLCDVVVFHRSMVSWRRRALVYVHSAICETDLV